MRNSLSTDVITELIISTALENFKKECDIVLIILVQVLCLLIFQITQFTSGFWLNSWGCLVDTICKNVSGGIETMPRINKFVPVILKTVILFCVEYLFGEANIASYFLSIVDG